MILNYYTDKKHAYFYIYTANGRNVDGYIFMSKQYKDVEAFKNEVFNKNIPYIPIICCTGHVSKHKARRLYLENDIPRWFPTDNTTYIHKLSN
jgi:hypothetical protein